MFERIFDEFFGDLSTPIFNDSKMSANKSFNFEPFTPF